MNSPSNRSDSPPDTGLQPAADISQVDISRSVNLASTTAVFTAIDEALRDAVGDDYGRELLRRAVNDVANAFRGDHPQLLRCDTHYHDLRHAFDSALAMARLINGYNKADPDEVPATMDPPHALLGVLMAMFHDIGMLRTPAEGHLQGAQLTRVHEERSVRFLREWLVGTPLADLAGKATLIMVTRLDLPFPANLQPLDRALACMLGTADILSQLADRCYLEKCRDFLFEEFRTLGIAGEEGSEFPDPETLLRRTPDFFLGPVMQRLVNEYEGMQRMMALHFGGECPYAESIVRNFRYLERVLVSDEFHLLRRQPERLIDARR